MNKALYIKGEYLKEKSETEYNTNKYKARLNISRTPYIEITPKGANYFYKQEIDNFHKSKYNKGGRKKATKQIPLEKKKEINNIIKEILFSKKDIKIKEIEFIDNAFRILIE